MSDAAHLTVREFNDRMTAQDNRLSHLTTLIEVDQKERRQRDLETERRVTVLETYQERRLLGVGVVSSLVAAVVGGGVGWLVGR